jgi:hypothetical protein
MYQEKPKNHLNIEMIKAQIEDLTKLQINSLKEICPNQISINSKELPEEGGIYAFWWVGDKKYFYETINRKLIISTIKKRKLEIEISDEWLDSFDNHICLYVGKTSSIAGRIGKHLMLSEARHYNCGEEIFNQPKKTTSGQLRRGMEELFFEEKDVRKLMLESIGLSYLTLKGDENAANRFYLEDRAIGQFFPIINIDVER